jgi:BASS family bile acid:Na+ symporter
LRRPGLVIAATAWTTIGIPILFGTACVLVGLDRSAPDLFQALILQAVTSPMMAAPAFASLMGLDATLVLVTLVASSCLIPVSIPLFTALFVGPGLAVSPAMLGVTLLAILGGSAVVGLGVRHLVGPSPIERFKNQIDGFNILVLFVFVAAVMENAAWSIVERPTMMVGLALLAFALFAAIFTVTALIFIRAGRERALALAFMTAQRNMGLMVAATGGALPELTWLYFAMCQFPIYFSPQLLKPVVTRLVRSSRIARL